MKNKKINLTITGCLGRMGQQLIKSADKDKKFKINSLTENNVQRKKILGILPKLNSPEAFKKSDVIIDFTIPKCTLEVLNIAVKQKKRVIIGTTGFTLKEENIIKKISRKIPILKAGNMSLGINLLMYLTEIASKSLGNNFLSKVFEVHHKHKKDHPSGTALMLGKGVAIGKNKNLNKLMGNDTIISLKNSSTRSIYHIRFHLVDGVSFNFTNNKKNIILKTKLNNMWIFKSDLELIVEDSILVDNNTTIPTKQIVIKGILNNNKLERKWSLEKL